MPKDKVTGKQESKKEHGLEKKYGHVKGEKLAKKFSSKTRF